MQRTYIFGLKMHPFSHVSNCLFGQFLENRYPNNKPASKFHTSPAGCFLPYLVKCNTCQSVDNKTSWIWRTPYNLQPLDSHDLIYGLRQRKPIYVLLRLKTKFGERAFSHTGPPAWNALPTHIRNVPSPNSFRKLLKTHFFCLAFNVY